MRKAGGVVLLALAFAGRATTVVADEEDGAFALGVSAFSRFEPILAVDGRNPNNRVIGETARDLNLFRFWNELELTADVGEWWRLFGKFRLITDNEDNLDGRLRNFDHFPNDFAGNGWMLRLDNDHASFEAWELYSDFFIGNLWLRLGKQQVVWGETLAFRLLDVVNPLDLSWHLFLDPFEEFDNIRIPQWTGRAVYEIPNPWLQSLTVEGIANPGDAVPVLLPDQGSPYNIVPTFVEVNDKVPRGEWTYGGRLTGKLYEVFFSVAGVSKPFDEPIAQFTEAVIDPRLGLPTEIVPGTGITLPFRFVNDGIHPRVDILGGSANYYEGHVGAVLRMEVAAIPNHPYQKKPPPNSGSVAIVERPTYKYALTVERPLLLIPGEEPTLFFSLSFFQTLIDGKRSNIRNNLERVSGNQEILALAFSQPFFRKTLFADFLVAYDLDDASWVQPGIRWIYGDHWRFDAFANVLGGAEQRPGRLGYLKWADEVGFRITYGI